MSELFTTPSFPRADVTLLQMFRCEAASSEDPETAGVGAGVVPVVPCFALGDEFPGVDVDTTVAELPVEFGSGFVDSGVVVDFLLFGDWSDLWSCDRARVVDDGGDVRDDYENDKDKFPDTVIQGSLLSFGD